MKKQRTIAQAMNSGLTQRERDAVRWLESYIFGGKLAGLRDVSVLGTDLATQIYNSAFLDRSDYSLHTCKECTDDVPCNQHRTIAEGRSGFAGTGNYVTHFAISEKDSGATVCSKTVHLGSTTIHREDVTCKDCLRITEKYEEEFDVTAILFRIDPRLLTA